MIVWKTSDTFLIFFLIILSIMIALFIRYYYNIVYGIDSHFEKKCKHKKMFKMYNGDSYYYICRDCASMFTKESVEGGELTLKAKLVKK